MCAKEYTSDYEISTVSFRPFYLTREFGQILAYVPEPNDEAAAAKVAESYNKALTRSADQTVLISRSCTDAHEFTDCITSYIQFCEENVCATPKGESFSK